jgi:hypothetical protein
MWQTERSPEMKNAMHLHRHDGTTIETVPVTRCKRFSMQAASDHKAADNARAKHGAELHHAAFHAPGSEKPYVVLHFDGNGRSFHKGVQK